MAHDIAAVAALNDKTRAALYFHVSDSNRDVSRDDAAQALGLPRRIAAFHLDRLVDVGLLEVTFKRLSGKTGPGAGRPSKLYRCCAPRVEVGFPPRNYELLARILAMEVEERDSGSGRGHRERGAQAIGASIGRAARAEAGYGATPQLLHAALMEKLAEHGFEPFLHSDKTVRLRNCPYHEMARENSELICSLNLSLMLGVEDGLGDAQLRPVLEPLDGACCVAFRPTPILP